MHGGHWGLTVVAAVVAVSIGHLYVSKDETYDADRATADGCYLDARADVREFVRFVSSDEAFQPDSPETVRWMPVLKTSVRLLQQQPAMASKWLRAGNPASLSIRWQAWLLAEQSLENGGARAEGESVSHQSCKATGQELLATNPVLANDLANFVAYVSAMVRLLQRRLLSSSSSVRSRAVPEENKVASSKAVVIGCGPVGLLVALQAFADGCEVTAVEKRPHYTRETWFDLYSEPWYPSQTVLASYGWRASRSPVIQHEEDGGGAVTVQARYIEAFLARAAMTVGITTMYRTKFVCHLAGSEQHPPQAVLRVLDTQRISNRSRCVDVSSLVDASGSCGKLLSGEPSACFLLQSFDILIGADGPKSVVRDIFNMGFSQRTSFLPLGAPEDPGAHLKMPETAVQVADLRQVSIVFHFKENSVECQHLCLSSRTEDQRLASSHRCPCAIVKYNPETNCPETVEGDPWRVGFHVPGVSSVFKRFYEGRCHLQVFFLEEHGRSVLAAYEQHEQVDMFATAHSHAVEEAERQGEDNEHWQLRALPWEDILTIVNHLFTTAVRSAADLRSLAATVGSTGPLSQRWDVRVVTVRIFEAESMITHLPSVSVGDAAALRSAPLGGSALVVLAGDARMTANYRLGVGINSAFWSLPQFSDLFRDVNKRLVSPQSTSMLEVASLVERYNASFTALVDKFVQLQLSTMFYESYCGLVVFFHPSHIEPDVLKAQVLYARAEGAMGYAPAASDAVEDCLARAT